MAPLLLEMEIYEAFITGTNIYLITYEFTSFINLVIRGRKLLNSFKHSSNIQTFQDGRWSLEVNTNATLSRLSCTAGRITCHLIWKESKCFV